MPQMFRRHMNLHVLESASSRLRMRVVIIIIIIAELS